MTTVFDELDSDQSYVCRVEVRKENGHYHLTNAANANRKRIATPGNIGLARTAPDEETLTFSWSLDDTDGISKLLVQRDGPFPNTGKPTEPSWTTIAELEPDATSHVDPVAAEDEIIYYNYRVIAVPERGGSTASWGGMCLLERADGAAYYHCPTNKHWGK